MVGANVFAADTDAEARRLFTSHQQAFTLLRRGMPGQIPAPIDDIEKYWTPAEKAMANQSLACSFVGSSMTVERGLDRFIEVTKPDELMVTGIIYDRRARLRSFEIAAEVRERMGSGVAKLSVPAAGKA
jgi:alkanesulfonate monooxygenase SsuD/methylene tetrahydromethanopterin reductase-like flavin-dependent oxidoreductase (luciferase family)